MKQVYIHGLGQTPASWEKTISYLENDKQILCPDLAEIIGGREVTYQNLYEAFSEVCDEIDGPIDLCGLSLGGVLALSYAVNHPKKINSLVLIAAQYKMPKKLLRFQNALFRFMPKSTFQQTGFEKKQFIQLCETMMELDLSESINKISCPALVVCGNRDRANKKASMDLAGILEHADIEIVEGSGHEINIDAPEKLAKVLQAFYDRIA